MRRELIRVFVASSAMIVLAFVVPLALSARSTSRDRAIDAARNEAAEMTTLLATGDRAGLVEEVDTLNATGRVAVTVLLPDRTELGVPSAIDGRLEEAVAQTRSVSGPVDGGWEVVTVVALNGGEGDGGERAAVRVVVPNVELHRGLLAAWSVLATLGVLLILLVVAIADRIAQRVVRPAERLAAAATALGQGRLDVRVEREGPPELAATAEAFNTLAGQVDRMLDDEREMVSELTHRLRTPLTRLRIGLDQIADTELAAKLQLDVQALTAEVNEVIARARRKADPPQGVDLAEVAAARFEFWSALADDEGRACRFRSEATAVVPQEADEVEAMLDVMLENVFAHTPSGTPFELSIERTDEGCILAVDDGGDGFDPELVAVGVSGGGSTGLGLSIVERSVRAWGGRLRVEPSALGGARVVCVVPDPAPDRLTPIRTSAPLPLA